MTCSSTRILFCYFISPLTIFWTNCFKVHRYHFVKVVQPNTCKLVFEFLLIPLIESNSLYRTQCVQIHRQWLVTIDRGLSIHSRCHRHCHYHHHHYCRHARRKELCSTMNPAERWISHHDRIRSRKWGEQSVSLWSVGREHGMTRQPIQRTDSPTAQTQILQSFGFNNSWEYECHSSRFDAIFLSITSQLIVEIFENQPRKREPPTSRKFPTHVLIPRRHVLCQTQHNFIVRRR